MQKFIKILLLGMMLFGMGQTAFSRTEGAAGLTSGEGMLTYVVDTMQYSGWDLYSARDLFKQPSYRIINVPVGGENTVTFDNGLTYTIKNNASSGATTITCSNCASKTKSYRANVTGVPKLTDGATVTMSSNITESGVAKVLSKTKVPVVVEPGESMSGKKDSKMTVYFPNGSHVTTEETSRTVTGSNGTSTVITERTVTGRDENNTVRTVIYDAQTMQGSGSKQTSDGIQSTVQGSQVKQSSDQVNVNMNNGENGQTATLTTTPTGSEAKVEQKGVNGGQEIVATQTETGGAVVATGQQGDQTFNVGGSATPEASAASAGATGPDGETSKAEVTAGKNGATLKGKASAGEEDIDIDASATPTGSRIEATMGDEVLITGTHGSTGATVETELEVGGKTYKSVNGIWLDENGKPVGNAMTKLLNAKREEIGSTQIGGTDLDKPNALVSVGDETVLMDESGVITDSAKQLKAVEDLDKAETFVNENTEATFKEAAAGHESIQEFHDDQMNAATGGAGSIEGAVEKQSAEVQSAVAGAEQETAAPESPASPDAGAETQNPVQPTAPNPDGEDDSLAQAEAEVAAAAAAKDEADAAADAARAEAEKAEAEAQKAREEAEVERAKAEEAKKKALALRAEAEGSAVQTTTASPTTVDNPKTLTLNSSAATALGEKSTSATNGNVEMTQTQYESMLRETGLTHVDAGTEGSVNIGTDDKPFYVMENTNTNNQYVTKAGEAFKKSVETSTALGNSRQELSTAANNFNKATGKDSEATRKEKVEAKQALKESLKNYLETAKANTAAAQEAYNAAQARYDAAVSNRNTARSELNAAARNLQDLGVTIDPDNETGFLNIPEGSTEDQRNAINEYNAAYQKIKDAEQEVDDAGAGVIRATDALDSAKAEEAQANEVQGAANGVGADLTDIPRMVVEILTPLLAEDDLTLKADLNIKHGDIGEAVGAVDDTSLGTDLGDDASAASTVVGAATTVSNLLSAVTVDLGLLSEEVTFPEEEETPQAGTAGTPAGMGSQTGSTPTVNPTSSDDDDDDETDPLVEKKRQEIERRREELMGQYVAAAIQVAEGMNAISNKFFDRANVLVQFSEGITTEAAAFGLAQDAGRYVLLETLRGIALSSIQMGVQATRLLNEQVVEVSNDEN